MRYSIKFTFSVKVVKIVQNFHELILDTCTETPLNRCFNFDQVLSPHWTQLKGRGKVKEYLPRNQIYIPTTKNKIYIYQQPRIKITGKSKNKKQQMFRNQLYVEERKLHLCHFYSYFLPPPSKFSPSPIWECRTSEGQQVAQWIPNVVSWSPRVPLKKPFPRVNICLIGPVVLAWKFWFSEKIFWENFLLSLASNLNKL